MLIRISTQNLTANLAPVGTGSTRKAASAIVAIRKEEGGQRLLTSQE
jgi:hypothetical protein